MQGVVNIINQITSQYNNGLDFLRQYDLIAAIIIIIVALIVGIIAKYIIRFITKYVVTKTETELDDKIIEALENPFLFGIFLCGVFLALLSIKSLEIYTTKIITTWQITGFLLATFIVIKIVNIIFKYHKTTGLTIANKKVDMKYSNTLRRVVNIIIWIISGLLILKHLKVEITPLIGALGIGGLAIALALQDTISNFFSGFWIISERQIGIGDWIEIQGDETKGYIDDIGWRTTRVRNFNDNFIVIPNSKLSQAVVVNFTKPNTQYVMPVSVSITYNSDLEKTEKLALETAKKIQKTEKIAVKDFDPWLSYKEYGESSINFTIGLKVEDFPDRFAIRHMFIKELKKVFDKNNIEFAYPTRIIYMKK
jgi:small-conductance mechanosensitive channel